MGIMKISAQKCISLARLHILVLPCQIACGFVVAFEKSANIVFRIYGRWQFLQIISHFEFEITDSVVH
jgi:hypothetical protein